MHAVCTSVKRNPNFAKLQAGYLFPEVRRAWSVLLDHHEYI